MVRKKQKQETTTPPQVVKEAEPQKRFSAFTDEPSVIPTIVALVQVTVVPVILVVGV